MAAIEGRLYVVGGVGPASEEIWVYDPATDSWGPRRPGSGAELSRFSFGWPGG